jgi:hypothetical protein
VPGHLFGSLAGGLFRWHVIDVRSDDPCDRTDPRSSQDDRRRSVLDRLQDFSTARDSAPYSRSTIAEATTWSVKTSVQSPKSRLR